MCVEMHWILNFIKTYNMKILQVAFLFLFNYLDSLPKLYYYANILEKMFTHFWGI